MMMAYKLLPVNTSSTGVLKDIINRRQDLLNNTASQLIGMEITEACESLGYWWVLESQHVTSSGSRYNFGRVGVGKLSLFTNEKSVVVQTPGKPDKDCRALPKNNDSSFFFRLQGSLAELRGAIGYLRIDFGKSGREFYSTWFDIQPNLKTFNFDYELDSVINSLRDDGDKPPFASRNNLKAFCADNPGDDLGGGGFGYMVRTLNFTFYFRCRPCTADYDVYCFAYDNRRHFPALEINTENGA